MLTAVVYNRGVHHYSSGAAEPYDFAAHAHAHAPAPHRKQCCVRIQRLGPRRAWPQGVQRCCTARPAQRRHAASTLLTNTATAMESIRIQLRSTLMHMTGVATRRDGKRTPLARAQVFALREWVLAKSCITTRITCGRAEALCRSRRKRVSCAVMRAAQCSASWVAKCLLVRHCSQHTCNSCRCAWL